MNILVTLNNNYIPHLKTMLKSFFATNDESVDLYIIHSSLTIESLNSVARLSNRLTIHPIFIDDSYFVNAHFTKRISKETYYRLLLCDYLPNDVERILYLDPDIIIQKSLNDLYNIDFGNNCIAGAGHTRGIVKWFNKKRLNMGRNCDYINAGVLMINVKNYKRYITSRDIFDFVGKMGKRLFQADQDVINAMLWKRTIYLPSTIYNLDEKTFKNSGMTLQDVSQSTAIIHYDGKNKPWNENYKGELNVFYKKYCEKSIGLFRKTNKKVYKSFSA